VSGARDLVIDHVSLLADVDASLSLAACEERLRASGLTLGLAATVDPTITIAAWLARGTPGARDAWLDPVDHVVAGLEATVTDGRPLTIRPAPRRAVGPDLVALVVGMNERFATVTRAWLRVHPVGIARPSTHPLVIDRDPPLGEGETALLDAIDSALRNP
jgi:alkyldihydroxyacetonephosphate synthase